MGRPPACNCLCETSISDSVSSESISSESISSESVSSSSVSASGTINAGCQCFSLIGLRYRISVSGITHHGASPTAVSSHCTSLNGVFTFDFVDPILCLSGGTTGLGQSRTAIVQADHWQAKDYTNPFNPTLYDYYLWWQLTFSGQPQGQPGGGRCTVVLAAYIQALVPGNPACSQGPIGGFQLIGALGEALDVFPSAVLPFVNQSCWCANWPTSITITAV